MAIEECYILIYVTIPLFHFQQDSPDTPGKKTKLNELKTPQPKKTLAIGSPSLRRKSMEPTKPKVLFTGVIDEHGQKVLFLFYYVSTFKMKIIFFYFFLLNF